MYRYNNLAQFIESHSAWSAWIEMNCPARARNGAKSHSAWSAWIEIMHVLSLLNSEESRTPHGVRGLKWPSMGQDQRTSRSHSAWSAWIEIRMPCVCRRSAWSHSAWSAWIEILNFDIIELTFKSHSAWSAWIEMIAPPFSCACFPRRTPHGVRGLKSDPDRSSWRSCGSHSAWSAWIEIISQSACMRLFLVAFRKECVD